MKNVAMKNLGQEKGADKVKPAVLSVEEAQKLLKLPQRLPAHLEAILGRPLIEKIYAVLDHEECRALDTIVLTDEMGLEAGMQYMAHVEDFRLVNQEIDSLAEEIVKAIGDKNRFQNYFERSFRVGGRAVNGSRPLDIALDNGIAKLFSVVPELCLALQPKERATFRGGLLSKLLMRSQQILFIVFRMQLPELVRKSKFSDSIDVQECLRGFTGALEQLVFGNSQGREGASPVGFLIQAERALIKWGRMHAKEFNFLVDKYLNGGDEKALTDVLAQCENTTEEILELSKTRRVRPSYMKIDGVIFQVIPWPNYAEVVCQIAICKEEEKDNQNLPIFTLDRGRMELVIGKTISKLGDFIPPEQAAILKSFALEVVAKELRKTPEFYADYLIAEPKPEEIVVIVQGEVGEVINEVAQSIVEMASQKERMEGRMNLQRLYPNIDFTRFKNLAGKEVLSILIRILGPPRRVAGSHHIFKSQAGVSLPVPVHGNNPISAPLLVNNLRKWGILEEFYERI